MCSYLVLEVDLVVPALKKKVRAISDVTAGVIDSTEELRRLEARTTGNVVEEALAEPRGRIEHICPGCS